MNTALLEQLNSVRHCGTLQNVRSAGHQLKISDDKYPHSGFGNVLHSTHNILQCPAFVNYYELHN